MQKIDFSNIRNTINKIRRFGFYAPLSNIILNYFGKFIPGNIKTRMYDKRNRIIQSYLAPILDTIGDEGESAVDCSNELNIWVCWFQGEEAMPELTKVCLSSIRRNAGGHKVILLTSKNYKEYVKIHPAIISRYDKGELTQAHFADIIRMNLLAQQGGLWLDATMLVTKPIPDEIFNYQFYSIKTENSGYFVSQCRWAVFMLACKPGNVILTKVSKAFERYLLTTDVFADYFMFDHFIDLLYKSNNEVKTMIDAVPYNNPDVHWLGGKLCDRFDAGKLMALSSRTTLFKLSNRAYSIDELNKHDDTYYSHIKKMYLPK